MNAVDQSLREIGTRENITVTKTENPKRLRVYGWTPERFPFILGSVYITHDGQFKACPNDSPGPVFATMGEAIDNMQSHVTGIAFYGVQPWRGIMRLFDTPGEALEYAESLDDTYNLNALATFTWAHDTA